jgi:C-terminal processing protease CtpA/Prc
MFEGLDACIVVISQFKTSPAEIAGEIRKRYHILSIGFQVTDQATFQAAVPIVQNKLAILTEWLQRHPEDSKNGN